MLIYTGADKVFEPLRTGLYRIPHIGMRFMQWLTVLWMIMFAIVLIAAIIFLPLKLPELIFFTVCVACALYLAYKGAQDDQ